MGNERITKEQRQHVHRIIDALLDSSEFAGEVEVDPQKIKNGTRLEYVHGYNITITLNGYMTHKNFGQVFAK